MALAKSAFDAWSKTLTVSLLLALLAVLVACGGEPESTTDATQNSSSQPSVDSNITQTPEPIPTVAASLTTEELPLTILSPGDGTQVSAGAIRVFGQTRQDAAVAINGTPTELDVDGMFQHDVVLEEGANLIEIVSTDLFGQVSSESLAVFFNALAEGLPLSLLHPMDGSEVGVGAVMIIGVTNPDAAVAINGSPTETNALGIFSAEVTLEEGANFIEVVATDLQARTQSQSRAVFYAP